MQRRKQLEPALGLSALNGVGRAGQSRMERGGCEGRKCAQHLTTELTTEEASAGNRYCSAGAQGEILPQELRMEFLRSPSPFSPV